MRTRRRGSRRMSMRKRRERMRTIRRRVLMILGITVLGVLAMAQDLRTCLADLILRGTKAIQTAAVGRDVQTEITLEEMNVYALQLGAYDNGEHAQSEMSRLQNENVLCVVWQREQMRLVCDAAKTKNALSAGTAKGQDAWVIADSCPEVVLRVSTDAAGMEDVRMLLTLPDVLFSALCAGEESVSGITARTKPVAQSARIAYPDNTLYTQLAQSLINWCTLMDNAVQTFGEATAMPYARVTMCTLCYELRQALIADAAQSAASTASAQRTPSTAADVMPPA